MMNDLYVKWLEQEILLYKIMIELEELEAEIIKLKNGNIYKY